MRKNYITYCSGLFTGLTMKLQRRAALLLFVIFGVLSAQAQVTVAGAVTGDGTYTNLGAAFTAIGTTQTGANITVTITGDTSESAIAVLTAGDWTSLTIKPSGGVWTISGSLASELIQFNGADNVTINGLNSGGNGLTISNTNTAAAAGTVKFQNDATNNTITNCSVLGSTTAGHGANGGVIYFAAGTTTGNDGNTISYCNIGPAGTNLPSKLIQGDITAASATAANSGILITNCNLYDYFINNASSSAIYVGIGNTDWTITNNRMYQTATRTFTATGLVYGIMVSSPTYGSNFQITGNVMGYANSAGTGTLTVTGSSGGVQGIYLLGMPNTSHIINNNTISNISLTSTTGTFYGIYSGTGTGASNTINVNNNTVRNIATITTTGVVNPIYAGTGSTVNCNNNTIDNITRTGATGVLYGINYGNPANITLNANTITNLGSTHATSTGAVSGINSGTATIETITNNTITNLTSSSTGAQAVIGINMVGGAGNKTIQNNTLSNFTVPTAATGNMHGIRMVVGGALNVISGNTIGALTGPNSAGGTNGVFINAGTVNNIYNNKVYGLTAAGTGACVFGIMIQGGTTYNVYNNIIGDLTAPNATSTAAEPHQIIAINTWGNAMTLYNNTIVLNGTNNGTGFGSSVLSTSGPITLRNNIMINTLPASGVRGVSTILRFGAGGVSNYNAASNNNLFKGSVIFTTDGTIVDNTLDAFKARVVNRDGLSVSENPSFLSVVGSDANYLHINPAVATQIESGGAPIASVTDDFDGTPRNVTTPDIGADEFAGIAAQVVLLNSIGITPTGNLCVASSRTVTANITAGGSDVTSVLLRYSFNGIPQTPIAMTGGTLTAGTTSTFSATIPAAVPVGANVTWDIVVTDPVTSKLLVGTTYKDAPLYLLSASASPSLSNICLGGTSVLSAGIVPQVTPFGTSFESGITEFAVAAVAGTPSLAQSTTYFSDGAASMRLSTTSTSANISASCASNIDLSTMSQAYLTFSHIAAMEGPTTSYDYGYVQFSNDGGTTWVSFPTSSYMGSGTLFNSVVSFSTKSYANWISTFTTTTSVPNNGLWKNETIAIPAAALTSQFRIRFRYTTDTSTNYYGWLIDNVKIISALPTAVTNYSWSDGSTVVGTTNNLSVSPATTTTYTATITSSGCTLTSNPVTITVAPIVPTTFAQVGPICSGKPLVLPTTSIEGIAGTWSPAVNNTATTTYTFTPNAGQCGTTSTMTVTITPNVTTTFAQVPAICSGTTLAALPTSSIEGIMGTWSPALNNAATTTYTFTPTTGQCGTTATMTITVMPNVATFTQVPAICSGATLAALPTTSIEGIAGTWSPAVNNTATTTYTFTPNMGQCGTPTTMTITVTPIVTTTFAQVPAICSGSTLVLPTTSIEGIVGTWSPAVNNTTTTTYTFTPNAGQCGTPATMTVTVTPNVTPTFTQVAPICPGNTLSALPTLSNEGIAGTWSPALNNMATTTYTFTPNAGQCGTTSTMVITVNSAPAPTGSGSQTMAQGQTVGNLSAAGSNITWYASAADAANGVNPLPSTTVLVNNGVYHATQTVGGCRSTSTLAVTVVIVLGNNEFDSREFKFYPNPVADVLNVAYSQRIQSIVVYNAIGQQVALKVINAAEAKVDMSKLSAGAYFVKVTSDNAVKTIKVIKK